MGEYVSLDMGCTWKFESSLFNSNELQSLEFFSYFVRFQCFSLGDLCRSSRRTGLFLLRRCLWTQKDVNVVARVNGTQYAKVSAVMATVNIVQTLDVWMIVVNVGRRISMSDLSELVNSGGLIIKEPENEPPINPIKVANWLIDRGLKNGIRLYGKSELKQIAKHLLIYCGDE